MSTSVKLNRVHPSNRYLVTDDEGSASSMSFGDIGAMLRTAQTEGQRRRFRISTVATSVGGTFIVVGSIGRILSVRLYVWGNGSSATLVISCAAIIMVEFGLIISLLGLLPTDDGAIRRLARFFCGFMGFIGFVSLLGPLKTARTGRRLLHDLRHSDMWLSGSFSQRPFLHRRMFARVSSSISFEASGASAPRISMESVRRVLPFIGVHLYDYRRHAGCGQ